MTPPNPPTLTELLGNAGVSEAGWRYRFTGVKGRKWTVQTNRPAWHRDTDRDVELERVFAEPDLRALLEANAAQAAEIAGLREAATSAAQAIDDFALDFIMAHDASPADSTIRLTAFREAVRRLCAAGIEARTATDTGSGTGAATDLNGDGR